MKSIDGVDAAGGGRHGRGSSATLMDGITQITFLIDRKPVRLGATLPGVATGAGPHDVTSGR